MDSQQRIRDAFDRVQHVFDKRPAAAQVTPVMRALVVDGTRCEASEGDWRFTIDMPTDMGSTNTGPTPGVHAHAALASCLAMGYSIELARAGFTPRSVEVEVQADYDSRGLVGMAGVKPGPSAVRHTLYLDCDGPREALQAIIDKSQSQSTYLEVFAKPQAITGQVVFGSRKQD